MWLFWKCSRSNTQWYYPLMWRGQIGNHKSLTYNHVLSFAWAKDALNIIPKDFSTNSTLISVTSVISEFQNLIMCSVKNCFYLNYLPGSFLCAPVSLLWSSKKNPHTQKKNHNPRKTLQEINTLFSHPQAIHDCTDCHCRWYYVSSNCLFSRQKISYTN